MNTKNGITWTELNKDEDLQRQAINQQLLDIAGCKVNVPISNINTHLNKYFAEKGVFVTDKNININMLFPFTPCNSNSSFTVSRVDENLHLYYGYCMNNEGVWSEHSWCVDPENNTIIESTKQASCYFGINLTKIEGESESFIKKNINATIENVIATYLISLFE